jgi:signal peptidase I
MLPTLLEGEFVFLEQPHGGDSIHRGDIIAFYAPPQAWFGQRVEFIKRVVALPGDQVEMRDGIPVLNGTPAVQTASGEYSLALRKALRLQERLPSGRTYEILKYGKGQPFDNGRPVIVPKDSYFVLGDNRDDSIDSRGISRGSAWWFVPASDVTGRAVFVYWSGFEHLDRLGLAPK